MSEFARGDAGKTATIVLVSSSDSFHSTLLTKFLEEKIQASCTVVSADELSPIKADLLLLDCAQNTGDELSDSLRQLSTIARETTIALLNAQHEDEHELLIDWPSIYGIFYIDTDEDQLLRGIEQLLEGDYWVPRRLLHQFFNKHRQSPAKNRVTPISSINLTNREREILRMIKDGMSNSAVSESLELSEHTVKSHLYNIYKKIGVRNRMEASNWARSQQDLDAL